MALVQFVTTDLYTRAYNIYMCKRFLFFPPAAAPPAKRVRLYFLIASWMVDDGGEGRAGNRRKKCLNRQVIKTRSISPKNRTDARPGSDPVQLFTRIRSTCVFSRFKNTIYFIIADIRSYARGHVFVFTIQFLSIVFEQSAAEASYAIKIPKKCSIMTLSSLFYFFCIVLCALLWFLFQYNEYLCWHKIFRHFFMFIMVPIGVIFIKFLWSFGFHNNTVTQCLKPTSE